jgi:hypothetical protein
LLFIETPVCDMAGRRPVLLKFLSEAKAAERHAAAEASFPGFGPRSEKP